MKCKIVFNDGSWIIGRRINFWEWLNLKETQGTHHWIVLDSNDDMKEYIGKRIAIPIIAMKYLVIL
jgi:hypothetical protein